MKRTRVAATLTAAMATALTLTACGSDDGAGTGAAGGSEADLRAAVQGNVDAINDGDVDAVIAASSARCRAVVDKAELLMGFGLIDELYGDITLKELKILENDGTVARVMGTTGIQALDEDDGGGRWIYEEGEWRTDDCDDDGPGVDSAPTDDDTEDDDTEDTAAAGDLGVGESYTWGDSGVSVTIDSVAEFTEIGEWDFVTEGATPFRVTVTISNDGPNRLDLDDVAVFAEGATRGGDTNAEYFEAGHREIAGQLATGGSEQKTWDASLDAEYGQDVLITVSYWGDDHVWDDDPQWLATIE
jgi:hypothetical protein